MNAIKTIFDLCHIKAGDIEKNLKIKFWLIIKEEPLPYNLIPKFLPLDKNWSNYMIVYGYLPKKVHFEKKPFKDEQEAFRERRHLHVCDLWPWVVKKAYVIRCRLLYCTLVPGMMSVNVIVSEIWPLVYFCDLWPSPVTFIVCQGYH